MNDAGRLQILFSEGQTHPGEVLAEFDHLEADESRKPDLAVAEVRERLPVLDLFRIEVGIVLGVRVRSHQCDNATPRMNAPSAAPKPRAPVTPLIAALSAF